MKYLFSSEDPFSIPADCLVVGIPSGGGEQAKALDEHCDGALSDLIEADALDLRPGKGQILPAPEGLAARFLLILGLGSKLLDAHGYRKLAHAAGAVLLERGLRHAVFAVESMPVASRSADWQLRQAVLGFDAGHYRYVATRSEAGEGASGLSELTICAPVDDGSESLLIARALAEGARLTRELGNLPPNICNPAYLADRAREMAEAPNASVEVLDRTMMEDLGMGALLAVAAGSRNEPQLIVLRHQGDPDPEAKPYALVGKGITFDTGGISLKPGKAMDEMKYDMCGAGGVLGAFLTISRLGLPLNVIAVVPAVENMPDGQAYRPGDVVRTLSGKQVEVLNTDAEGRLILCDALTYVQRFEPCTIIDTATLTGACVVALGHHACGLMTRDDELAEELLAAGDAVHDRAWRLPLWQEYEQQLESPFADFSNLGGPGAGAITAGCFLAQFTEGCRWAHVDVAGSAWEGGTKNGASGRPANLLAQYLIDRAAEAR